jgi:hypothetical protein
VHRFLGGYLAPIFYRKPDSKKVRCVHEFDANASERVVSLVPNPYDAKIRPVLTISKAELQNVVYLDFVDR